jgi:hypothetical protein
MSVQNESTLNKYLHSALKVGTAAAWTVAATGRWLIENGADYCQTNILPATQSYWDWLTGAALPDPTLVQRGCQLLVDQLPNAGSIPAVAAGLTAVGCGLLAYRHFTHRDAPPPPQQPPADLLAQANQQRLQERDDQEVIVVQPQRQEQGQNNQLALPQQQLLALAEARRKQLDESHSGDLVVGTQRISAQSLRTMLDALEEQIADPLNDGLYHLEMPGGPIWFDESNLSLFFRRPDRFFQRALSQDQPPEISHQQPPALMPPSFHFPLLRDPSSFRLDRRRPSFEDTDEEAQPRFDVHSPEFELDADWELIEDNFLDQQRLRKTPGSAIQKFYDKWFKEHEDPGKTQKYRVVLSALLESFSRDENVDALIEQLIEMNSKESNDAVRNTLCCLIALARPERYRPEIRDARHQHDRFLHHLREGLNSSPPVEFCSRLLDKLAYCRYADVCIQSYLGETVDRVISSSQLEGPYPDEVNASNIADVLHLDNQKIKNAPVYLKKPKAALIGQKLSGHMNVNFDPPWFNTPYLRTICTFENPVTGQTVRRRVLRHGTPTREVGIGNAAAGLLSRATGLFRHDAAETVPEYEAFLRHAASRGERVSYFNHQQMIGSVLGDESDRSRAIQSNETRHPNFFFTALPLDGDVIALKGKWETMPIAQFQRELAESLLFGRNGYRLPLELRKTFFKDKQLTETGMKFREELIALFAEVHKRFFLQGDELMEERGIDSKERDRADLTPKEKRQVYLLLCHSCLKDFLNAKLGVQIEVSPCKDNIDRGNASTGIDEARHDFELGRGNDPEALHRLRVNTAAPPFLVKKQEVIPSRQRFLENVLRHFAKMPETQVQYNRQFPICGWRAARLDAPQDSGYTAVPSPRTAKTLGELNLFLEGLQRDNQWDWDEQNDLAARNLAPYRLNTNPNPLLDDLNHVAIMHQLQHDLSRSEVYLNGVRFLDAVALEQAVRNGIGGEPTQREIDQLLILLCQGTTADLIPPIQRVFMPNHLQLHVMQKPVSRGQQAAMEAVKYCKLQGEDASKALLINLNGQFAGHYLSQERLKELDDAIDRNAPVPPTLVPLLQQIQNDPRETAHFFSHLLRASQQETIPLDPNLFHPALRAAAETLYNTRVDAHFSPDQRQIKVQQKLSLREADDNPPAAHFLGLLHFDLSTPAAPRSYLNWRLA